MTYKYSNISGRRELHKIGADLDFAASEAYKLLRTNLTFAIPNKQEGRIVGMTSARPQDGKSFSAINLAYSLAEAGNQVILIDADMRRPSLANTLGKPATPGLSNYLVGEAKDVIHKNVLHPNLSLITAGDAPPNPAELIGSARMKMVLDALAQKYDYIIVDLPPVSVVSDTLVVSKHLDGVILVLRHARSKQSDVKKTVHQLKFVNARILGFVYNGYEKGSKVFRRRSYYDTSYPVKDSYQKKKNEHEA